MLRRLLPTAALAVGLCAPAAAHDRWATGDPVPAWVKGSCCGAADAHRLDESQVRRVPGGYEVDGYRGVIPADRELPSQDGEYWVFYATYPNGDQSSVYCFFVPMGS